MRALKAKVEAELIISQYNLQEVKKYIESKKQTNETSLQDNRGSVEGGASNGQDSTQ
jgi:hypothetical protein